MLTNFKILLLLLLMGGTADAATRHRREIIVVCDELKIVFVIPEKTKWSMQLVSDKKTYNCQIVENNHARR